MGLDTLDAPTFADVDFKFDGDAGTDDYVCNAFTIANDIQYATSDFTFNGIKGTFVNQLGARSRRIVWILTCVAKSHTELNTLIQLLEAKQQNGTWTLTMKGRTYSAVRLVSITPVGPGPEGAWEPVHEPNLHNPGPMVLQIFRLVFEDQTPI